MKSVWSVVIEQEVLVRKDRPGPCRGPDFEAQGESIDFGVTNKFYQAGKFMDMNL